MLWMDVGCAPARLAELTAALERRRSEDEEKEQAVEALTLQLRELVGAGCGGFLEMHVRHSQPDLSWGLQEAVRAREPTPEQVQTLRSELELLRRTLHEVTQVLGHPWTTHSQEGPLPASVSPAFLSVPFLDSFLHFLPQFSPPCLSFHFLLPSFPLI